MEDFIPLEADKKKPKKSSVLEKRKQNKEKRRQKRARIVVRNLSYKATDESFREHFEKYGKIIDINLLKKGDGKLVGCGFVQFEKVNQAAKAILKCNNTDFMGRSVIVDWALGKSEYEKRKSVKKEKKEEKKADSNIKEEDNYSDEENASTSETENTDDDENENSDEENEEGSSDEGEMDVDKEDDDSENEYKEEKKKVAKVDTGKTKFKSNDVKEERTVFLKNVPFDATIDDLRKVCRKFGPIHYAIINTFQDSGHSRGTAFVKFKTKESAELCLRSGEEFVLMDQVLEALPALSREDINSKGKKDDKHKDARNLYLIKEGVIMTGSQASEGVSASDMAKRHQIEQVKAQVLKNLNRFVSRNRLSIHNLPLDYDDEKLEQMIIKHTPFKPHECRIIRENKPSAGFPKGKPKGFGFMSFKNHKEALMALRKLNNNPTVFGSKNRPIVGFSIEDKSVHNIKMKRLEKSRQNNPNNQQRLDKIKLKKQKRLQKDNKVDVQKQINGKNARKNDKRKAKNNPNNDKSGGEENFMGMPAKPGSFVRMRSLKKIREQSQEHKKKLSVIKRKAKHQKERKQLLNEKKSIDRPKQGKKKQERDNFSSLVNKYKQIIDSKLTDRGVKKTKRTKWYKE